MEMRNIIRFAIVVALALIVVQSAALATVVNFDDLSGGGAQVPSGYAGLTWGTSSLDTVPGNTGYWASYDYLSYSTPHSIPNFVYNAWGADALWFGFATPVAFDGAWFTTAFGTAFEDNRAKQVRFRDDNGNVSSWLDLTNTPQYLAANFANASVIYVDRQGGIPTQDYGPGQWYTMDDVTYNEGHPDVPEAGSLLLAITGGLPVLGFAIRRRRS